MKLESSLTVEGLQAYVTEVADPVILGEEVMNSALLAYVFLFEETVVLPGGFDNPIA